MSTRRCYRFFFVKTVKIILLYFYKASNIVRIIKSTKQIIGKKCECMSEIIIRKQQNTIILPISDVSLLRRVYIVDDRHQVISAFGKGTKTANVLSN